MNDSRSSIAQRLFPYLILTLMLIPLLLPFLEPGYPFADDRFAPYLRVRALRAAVGDGQIPPRWFPEFDGGYGSPYPSFYAMLFYTVAMLFNLVGVNVGAAVELTAFLAVAAAALGMFVLARSLWGVRSGVLAAALYTFAPYHLVDAYIRGALSELAAFVWFPLIVYTTHQAILIRKPAWVVAGSLSIAGLILTHNLMSLVFLPVILSLLVILAARESGSIRSRILGVVTLGISAAFGLLLSAYFWLPIVFERGLLRLEYFLQYDFHGDFVGRGTLFAWDSARSPHTSIGMILLGAATLGAVVAVWPRSRATHKAIAVGALGAGLFFLFMTTSRSAWIWQRAPLLSFVQFPWRFLAPASFCLSLAAGPMPLVFRRGYTSWVVVILVGVAIYLQSAPLIRIPKRIDGSTISSMPLCQDVWGTQDYRPETSQAMFWSGPEPPADPGDPMVLQPCPTGVSLTSAGSALVLDYTRHGTQWEVRYAAAEQGVITVPQFYFPGWEARVDGAATPIQPSPVTGLLQIALPAGEHSLRLDYRDTPVRRTADWLSVAGIVALVWISGMALRKRRSADSRIRP